MLRVTTANKRLFDGLDIVGCKIVALGELALGGAI